MTIKQEYLDILIKCPFTGKMIPTTFMEPEMYIHYFNKGYAHIFMEDIEEIVEDVKEVIEEINDKKEE